MAEDIKINSFPLANTIQQILGLDSGKEPKYIAIESLKKQILDNITRLKITVSDGDGAYILGTGVGIVIGYDSSSIDRCIIFFYVRTENGNPIRIVLASNGVTLGAANNLGTSVLNGADTQVCLHIML